MLNKVHLLLQKLSFHIAREKNLLKILSPEFYISLREKLDT